MLRDFGTARLRDVLEPAIGYARDGHPVLPRVVQTIASLEAFFREHWPTSAEVWGAAERPWQLFRNGTLAGTYERILAEAEAPGRTRDAEIDAALDAWYGGFVAESIDTFVSSTEAMDSSGRRHRGLLAADDLRAWRPTLERPVELEYHGWTVSKTGPWGQGPVFLQQLALLDGFAIAELGYGSAEFVHTVVEAAKLAFADREAWYGDPAFADVPLDRLLSSDYADERRALIGAEASGELRPGLEGARLPTFASNSLLLAAGLGEPTRGDTCHVDVVDRFGNAVSATPSGPHRVASGSAAPRSLYSWTALFWVIPP
jgi:gamma-glutamyltranspeptidase/glutathione hydrolase